MSLFLKMKYSDSTKIKIKTIEVIAESNKKMLNTAEYNIDRVPEDEGVLRK